MHNEVVMGMLFFSLVLFTTQALVTVFPSWTHRTHAPVV